MMVRERSFPVVADDQPISQEGKVMALYDNEDLITNITDDYVDKDYGDVPKAARVSTTTKKSWTMGTQTPTQVARRQAKKDVKEKRQRYLAPESLTGRPAYVPKQQAAIASVVDFDASPQRTSRLARVANHLRQDDYILAEIPKHYKKPKNRSNKKRKNSYDFLKKSQIYTNFQEHRQASDVQELNLAQLEEKEN